MSGLSSPLWSPIGSKLKSALGGGGIITDPGDTLLLESADDFLLESGSYILLESN